MADETWESLLRLLRARDAIAWNQLIEGEYVQIHSYLLGHARRRNSYQGAPIGDPEVQEVTTMLTNDAFVEAMSDIEAFDPSKASLPTWIKWKGRAKMKGLLDPVIRFRKLQRVDLPPPRRADARDHLQGTPPSSRSAESEALSMISTTNLREQVMKVLAAMPADRAALLLRVWDARLDGNPFPIRSVAARAGVSAVAFDSRYRRAARDFSTRWQAAYGDDRGIGPW
jgi:hypothetical protein